MSITRVRARHGEQGFTLIELMIVVVIVGVLAAIVIPTFTSETKKTKASSEVAPMFAELSTRQEQYKIDKGRYLSAVACPATPQVQPQDVMACVAAGQPWETLRVQPPESKVRCSYQMSAGLASDPATIPAGFTFTQPPASWYFILATCEMDGEAASKSTYFTSSVNTTIQKQNEGR